MNLAFVNTSWQLGGAETVAQDLLQGCRAAGHTTRMYVAAGKTYPRRGDVVPLYPRVLSRLYHSRLHSPIDRFVPRFAWTDRAFRRLASGWPHVVHIHNFHGDYATVESLAHVARRKPLVWTFHGHWGVTGGCDHPLDCARYEQKCGDCPRLGIWPLGDRDDTARQLDLKTTLLGALELDVVAPSRFMAERIRRSRVGCRWRVHHIPNGVCTRTFSGARKRDHALKRDLGLDSGRVTILVVNRDFRDPQKGFVAVRDALATASSRVATSAQLVLAGRNSAWAASQVPDNLAVAAVGYVTSRKAIATLFEAADVFLFASPAETFPCVVLEAMASECCVVATPTSGVTEQLEDGRTGLLSRDTGGESLAAALDVALRSEDVRLTIGRAAREQVRAHFDLGAFVSRHLALYESLTTVGSARSVRDMRSLQARN